MAWRGRIETGGYETGDGRFETGGTSVECGVVMAGGRTVRAQQGLLSLLSAVILPLWVSGPAFAQTAIAGASSAAREAGRTTQPAALRWYKGNTHTHTLNSDGDTAPDEVARWYREQGYHFLVLTDHNFLTSVDGLNALLGADEHFVILPGEEITDRFNGAPLHINGLLVDRLVEPQGGTSVSDVIQRNVNAIRAANGIPHVNHPNFGWAVTAADLKRVKNDKLFEIYNGHPLVNNDGGGERPGLEEMWDDILSSGKLLFGLATDDAHHFKRPWDPTASKPGKGWVYVRAQRLSGRAVIAALERGDFYSSTGVELSDVVFANGRMTVTVKRDPAAKYRVRFIGKNGRVLKDVLGSPAEYVVQGTEGYVRAVVYESNGKRAWVQPVMLTPGS